MPFFFTHYTFFTIGLNQGSTNVKANFSLVSDKFCKYSIKSKFLIKVIHVNGLISLKKKIKWNFFLLRFVIKLLDASKKVYKFYSIIRNRSRKFLLRYKYKKKNFCFDFTLQFYSKNKMHFKLSI